MIPGAVPLAKLTSVMPAVSEEAKIANNELIQVIPVGTGGAAKIRSNVEIFIVEMKHSVEFPLGGTI